jgi:hypothetical protein
MGDDVNLKAIRKRLASIRKVVEPTMNQRADLSCRILEITIKLEFRRRDLEL